MREYKYVGSNELLSLVDKSSSRRLVQSQTDVLSWIQQTHQQPDAEGEVTATFIIDTNGNLWVADRHSEHVVCAAGGPVLSAGEMTFKVAGARAEVSAVTNQSTGFCPEPESWPSVASALDKIGLAHPDDFTTHFHFRRCDRCGSINIVKIGSCAVCVMPNLTKHGTSTATNRDKALHPTAYSPSFVPHFGLPAAGELGR